LQNSLLQCLLDTAAPPECPISQTDSLGRRSIATMVIMYTTSSNMHQS